MKVILSLGGLLICSLCFLFFVGGPTASPSGPATPQFSRSFLEEIHRIAEQYPVADYHVLHLEPYNGVEDVGEETLLDQIASSSFRTCWALSQLDVILNTYSGDFDQDFLLYADPEFEDGGCDFQQAIRRASRIDYWNSYRRMGSVIPRTQIHIDPGFELSEGERLVYIGHLDGRGNIYRFEVSLQFPNSWLNQILAQIYLSGDTSFRSRFFFSYYPALQCFDSVVELNYGDSCNG